MKNDDPQHGPVISAGILIGTGMGGFFDGILLHQLLQWHNMLYEVRPPVDLASMKYNMVWDGVFHAFTWLVTAAGVARLWRAGRRPDVAWASETFGGALLGGWGLFNLVEGLIDHQILGIHHVHPGANQLAWDLAYLASGLVMLGVGWVLIRAGRTQGTPRGGGQPVASRHTPSRA